MSITVYSYKLTQRELEARLEPGVTVLPGQLVRLEGSPPAYGKVCEVRALPAPAAGMPEGYGVVIELLYGTPGLGAQKITLLTAAQMAREVQKLQGTIEHPLQFAGYFVGELANLGAFTLVEGDDFLLKYDALQVIINAVKPYRRLLIIDPLGLFEEGEGFTYLKAGLDVRLSIQQIGSKRFLEAFGELFSPELRVPALRTLADHWPLFNQESGFVAFNRLLNLEAAVNVPLKNLIVQHYQSVVQSQVFADAPDQILNLGQVLHQPVCVVDISDMSAPWKQLFYEQLCETVFREGGGGLVPVLLYPEKYLPDLLGLAQQAEESGFNMLMMASPFAAQSLRDKASNRIWVESRSAMELQGLLTLGLPISFPLPANHLEEAVASTSYKVEPLEETRQESRFEGSVSSSLLGVTPPQGMEFSEPLPDMDDGSEPRGVSMPEEQEAFENTDQAGWEHSSSVPLEVAQMDEPSEPPMPIIDLSSPPPEPEITFLTAEQLSELLASSPKSNDSDEEAPEDWEGRMPSDSEDAEAEEADYLDLDYPATQAGAKNPSASQSSRAAPSVNIPVLFEDAPAELADGSDDTGFAYSSFQVDLDEAVEPPIDMQATPALKEEVSAAPAMPPPFPAPEEYEREEFNFDLNPDDPALFESSNGHVAAADGMTDTVSRSLTEFDEMDLAIDEPLFDLNPEEYSQSPSESGAMSQLKMPGGSELSQPLVTSNIPGTSLDEAEMQEALDLIFPQQLGSQPQSETPTAAPESEPVHVVGDEEQQVPVYQKPEVALPPKIKGYQVGDKVRHKSYGNGVIQKIIPMEETIILNIMFETVGKRLLDPSLCELKQDPD